MQRADGLPQPPDPGERVSKRTTAVQKVVLLCHNVSTEFTSVGLVVRVVSKLNFEHRNNFQRNSIVIPSDLGILGGPVHQKTCLECFLELLVGRNVSTVFVLVGG